MYCYHIVLTHRERGNGLVHAPNYGILELCKFTGSWRTACSCFALPQFFTPVLCYARPSRATMEQGNGALTSPVCLLAAAHQTLLSSLIKAGNMGISQHWVMEAVYFTGVHTGNLPTQKQRASSTDCRDLVFSCAYPHQLFELVNRLVHI